MLAVAERHPGRCPDEGGRRAWLYALARWACLSRLAERRRARQGAHSARRTPEHTDAGHAPSAHREPDVSAHRRTELARLAWPEAAGTTPSSAKPSNSPSATASGSANSPPSSAPRPPPRASCCPARPARSSAPAPPSPSWRAATARPSPASPATATCCCPAPCAPSSYATSTTARAAAAPPNASAPDHPGPAPAASTPRSRWSRPPYRRPRRHAALGGRRRGGRPGPRFDRTGFPMDPKDRAARRDRLRARAVTTTVVATVVAAPVLALWAAYRAAPATGEPVGGDGTRISASESQIPPPHAAEGRPLTAYENTGNTARTTGEPGFARGEADPDVSVEVISTGAPTTPEAGGPGAPGRLTVAATTRGSTTLLTLTASGGPRRLAALVGRALAAREPDGGHAGPRRIGHPAHHRGHRGPARRRLERPGRGGPGRRGDLPPGPRPPAPPRTRPSPRRRRPRRPRRPRRRPPPRLPRRRRLPPRPRRTRRPRSRPQEERFPRTRPRRGPRRSPQAGSAQAGSAGCGAIGSSEDSRASHSFTSAS